MVYHACRFGITQKIYNKTVLEFKAIKISYANTRTFILFTLFGFVSLFFGK